MPEVPLRFAAIGLNHIHIGPMVELLRGAGAELAAFHAPEPELAEPFGRFYADARRAGEPREIYEDPTIALVACAAVPDRRAAIAADAMRHGKDVFVDKPAAVRLDEVAMLRRVARETGRRFVVFFSERMTDPASLRAARLVEAGAIGTPIHTVGLGPHRLGLLPRPDWFWDPARSGGILADLASHQVDQFLFFTRCAEAEVVAAQVANRHHPERPGFEDFGELLLRGPHATGYARVDWFTPAGLPSWGDVRLTLLGTEGTIELRKNVDPAGREGGHHLILVDGSETRYVDCRDEPVDLGRRLLDDVRTRGETALGQEHALRATEIALEAQARAARLGSLAPGADPAPA